MEVLFSDAQDNLNIDCILFDLDGTLISSKSRLVDPIINQLHHYVDEIPTEKIEEGIKNLIKAMSNKSIIQIPIILWDISKLAGLSFFQRIKFLINAKTEFENKSDNFIPLENSLETLNYALNNYKVGIVTSAKRRDFIKLTKEYPIFGHIKAIITRDDVSKLKPNPEGIIKALNILEAKAERTLMIGDLPSDIRAAKQAKVKSAGFLGEFSKYTFELLSMENPDFIIEDHFDFIELLRNTIHPLNFV